MLEVLSLWRGVMLDGLSRGPVLISRCAIVEQDRLATVDRLAEVYLSLGHPVRAGALLQLQVLSEPLRERSHALLMRARYQTDGVAAALQAYETIQSARASNSVSNPDPSCNGCTGRYSTGTARSTLPSRGQPR
jgi:hypothetical protein